MRFSNQVRLGGWVPASAGMTLEDAARHAQT
jgi:hypothetical protein